MTETTYTGVKKLLIPWVSDESGDYSETSDFIGYDGKIIALYTEPAAGEDAPTDDYDVTLLDKDGTDVLLGAGLDRDTADAEVVASDSLGAVAGSPLTLVVANAGSEKGGTVIVYIR